MTDSLEKDREIAGRLHRTWPAFFETYGRLTNIQREAIPKILNGMDILICSATASGKTEAVCAPLIERNMDTVSPWTILYISPTRALVNDLYERLYTPLSRLHLSVLRRTGDHHGRSRSIPHVLITTPESFDSIMCRGRLGNEAFGHVLARVVAVVLDEIHLLYGTSRGEQVRWLVERLKRLKNQAYKSGWCSSNKIQIAGLSATVVEPWRVVEEFMPSGEALVVAGKREIIVVNENIRPVYVELPYYINKLEKPEKILVFSNTRKRVDDLAAGLGKTIKASGYKVVAHHGSLSKRVREDAEEAIKTGDKIIAFATSTLEIGIDIGDIDLIVLDGPPPDVPALLQRIGRGNRKTDQTRVMLCAEKLSEAFIQKAMIEAARNGWMSAADNGPNYSVAFQQVASYIFQAPTRSRKRSYVEDFVRNCSISGLAEVIVDYMKQREELVEDEAGIRLGEYWLNMTASGEIHSNIDSPRGYNIIDELSGEKIADGISFVKGKGLRAGGQLLQIKRFNDFDIEVKRVRNEQLAQGQWNYTAKERFISSSQANAIRKYLEIKDDVWPIVNRSGQVFIFHLGGTIRQTIIEAMARMFGEGNGLMSSNQFYFILSQQSNEKPVWIDKVRPANLELSLNTEIDWFERKLCRPDSNKKLPLNIRVEEIISWLNLDVEMCLIKESIWTTDIDRALRESLILLCE